MDGAFDAGLKAGAEVGVPAGSCGLGANYLQKAFGPKTTVDFSDTDGASARLLVQSDETVGHHGSVSCPRGMGVREPINPCRHLGSKVV